MKVFSISSISGQLERVAAEIMLDAGKIVRIETKDFPPGVEKVDAIGRPINFAVVFSSPEREAEFDALVRELRA